MTIHEQFLNEKKNIFIRVEDCGFQSLFACAASAEDIFELIQNDLDSFKNETEGNWINMFTVYLTKETSKELKLIIKNFSASQTFWNMEEKGNEFSIFDKESEEESERIISIFLYENDLTEEEKEQYLLDIRAEKEWH